MLLLTHILFLTNTHIDWGQLTESGLTSLVVTAVFVIIVKPMVTQMLKTNAESTKAYMKLVETISNGDSSIRANTKETEARVLESFKALIEPITTMKGDLKDIKDRLIQLENQA